MSFRAKILSLVLLWGLPINAQTYEDYKIHLLKYEGYSSVSYFDKFGNETIGIGHKMARWEKKRLTPDEIDALFFADLTHAKNYAFELTKNFNHHPKEVKIVIVSLVFNLGARGYSKFIRFRRAIDNFEYIMAANELKKSKWAQQLPERAIDYVKILKNVEENYASK